MSEGTFLHVSAHFIWFAIILLSTIEWFITVIYMFHMNSYRNCLRLYVHSLNLLTYMSKMIILTLESGYNYHLGVGIWQESQIIMGSNWDPVHSPSQLQVLWSCMFMFLSVQLIGPDTRGGGFTTFHKGDKISHTLSAFLHIRPFWKGSKIKTKGSGVNSFLLD